MRKSHTTRTYGPIHFEDLEPKRFEDLIRQLIYDFKDWQSIQGVGRAGDDAGFDIRAYEKVADHSEAEAEEEDVSEKLPMEGSLWMIQGKREKELGPKRVKDIIKEVDGKNPPYGFILAASANFSKESQDVFRDELRKKGVMEFYLWGKSELEGMLYLPKNDRILFTFFGISLSSKRRSRTTEVRSAVLMKNRSYKAIGTGTNLHQPVLIRDINDTNYPYKDKYKDFEKNPRWKEYQTTSQHPLGLILKSHRYLAYIDSEKKEWDFTPLVNLVDRQIESEEERQKNFGLRDLAESVWNFFPRQNQGYFVVKKLLAYEDMLLLDDKGDDLYNFPHIFVDFTQNGGPFCGGWEYLKLEEPRTWDREISLEGYMRVSKFPKKILSPSKVKLLKKKLEVAPVTFTAIRNYECKTLYDSTGKYKYLKKYSVVQITTSEEPNNELYIQITHSYRNTVKQYLERGAPSMGTRRDLQQQLGEDFDENTEIAIYEFKRASQNSFIA